jgi:hypothetical protein
MCGRLPGVSGVSFISLRQSIVATPAAGKALRGIFHRFFMREGAIFGRRAPLLR